MHRRAQRIIHDTVARWRQTLLQTGPADVEGAKKLIRKVYGKDTKIFVVNSPLEFYIAQGVLRRRIAKKYAQNEACKLLKIDPGFIDELNGIGRPLIPFNGQNWYRHITTNIMDRTIISFIKKVCDGAGFAADTHEGNATLTAGGSRWWSGARRGLNQSNAHLIMQYNACDLNGMYRQFIPRSHWSHQNWMKRAGMPVDDLSHLDHKLNFTTNRIEAACMTLYDAVSKNPVDITTSTPYKCENHSYDATQTEMICRMMGCNDPEITLNYEIFHHVPAVMPFNKAFLLLGNRPAILLNDEQNIHNESGQAVSYSDGTGFWYIDGHILIQAGEKIVMRPETLTANDIQEIENEEERRLAIERYGWEPYLTGVGAQVIDRRENWVDNTVEALINVPPTTLSDGSTTRESRRMLLSCRSTGRRYMLAAPQASTASWWRRDSARPLNTCEEMQDWMAGGATTNYLSFAKNKLRLVGAS